MPAFCTQCSAALEPDAKFCEECGAQVSGKEPSAIARPKRTLLLAVLSSAVALGVSALLFFFGNPSSLLQEVGKSPENARRELGQMGLQYSEEAFTESAKNGDALAIKLFLNAGMNPNAKNSER